MMVKMKRPEHLVYDDLDYYGKDEADTYMREQDRLLQEARDLLLRVRNKYGIDIGDQFHEISKFLAATTPEGPPGTKGKA